MSGKKHIYTFSIQISQDNKEAIDVKSSIKKIATDRSNCKVFTNEIEIGIKTKMFTP